MQRKPGYPVANSMKMDIGIGLDLPREGLYDEDEPQQRRQQLINFGHTQWGFNNWSWSVTMQDLDFAEPLNGKYTAGVACYVSVKVKSLDIYRDNVGYATSFASNKGLAIHRARKCAVTNALRETLMSFGGNVATELLELLESNKNDISNQITVPEVVQESNQNPLHKSEPKNMAKPNIRRETEANIPLVYPQKGPKNIVNPPVAKAHPMPANLPGNPAAIPAANPPATPAANLPPAANAPRPPYAGAPPAPGPAHVRPNSNVSFVMMPPVYGPPRLPPPHAFPNYYELSPWHFSYDPHNLNLPSRNLVLGRDCKREDYQPQQGCWIKPTIFYDGFWTEQKVRKWVAEQVEKQFPDDRTSAPPDSTSK